MSEKEVPPKFPTRLGNMTVGEVIEAAEGATRFQVGDRVFGTSAYP